MAQNSQKTAIIINTTSLKQYKKKTKKKTDSEDLAIQSYQQITGGVKDEGFGTKSELTKKQP